MYNITFVYNICKKKKKERNEVVGVDIYFFYDQKAE